MQVKEGASDDVKNRPVVPESELNSYALSPLHQHIQHYRLYTNQHYLLGGSVLDASLGFQQNIRREYNHPTDPSQAGLFLRLNTMKLWHPVAGPFFFEPGASVGVNGMVQDNKSLDATDFPIPDYRLSDLGYLSLR